MRASRWVPAGAAVLLVVGVLSARGGTAAGEEDLRPPVAGPEPSSVPSPRPAADAPLEVEANGIPGARLGSGGADLELWITTGPDGSPLDPAELPGGCVPAWTRAEDDRPRPWNTAVWVVDDLVSSVTVARWDPPTRVDGDITTWLGPTIGSPVQAASELPGAQTRTERPFGTAGPAVTVVRVPVGGAEVVYSDAVFDMGSRPDDAAGRVSTIEVRHPRARDCSVEALLAHRPSVFSGPGPAAELAVGLDGVTLAPLGTTEAALREVQAFQREGHEGGSEGCDAFSASAADGGWARVVTLDDVVVSTQVQGQVRSELGVTAGDTAADVRTAFPQLTDDIGPAGGSVEVEVGQRVVGIELWPDDRWVPDVDVMVSGGPPVVQGFTVRDAAVPLERLC